MIFNEKASRFLNNMARNFTIFFRPEHFSIEPQNKEIISDATSNDHQQHRDGVCKVMNPSDGCWLIHDSSCGVFSP